MAAEPRDAACRRLVCMTITSIWIPWVQKASELNLSYLLSVGLSLNHLKRQVTEEGGFLAFLSRLYWNRHVFIYVYIYL